MALPDRTQRLNQLGSEPERKLNAMTQIQVGGHKLGDGPEFFVYIDEELAHINAPGVGMKLAREGSEVLPGRWMTVSAPFTHFQFQQDAFHTLSREPSSAVLPHGTFEFNYTQQAEIAAFAGGIMGALTSALEFFRGA